MYVIGNIIPFLLSHDLFILTITINMTINMLEIPKFLIKKMGNRQVVPHGGNAWCSHVEERQAQGVNTSYKNITDSLCLQQTKNKKQWWSHNNCIA